MPTHPGKKGGRIPPDGRQASAKGVGKNSKRHDLERPATPGLHGSSLQKGDVQAMEEGQRIAPPGTQQPAQAPRPSGGGQQPRKRGGNGGMQIPDPIDFAGKRLGGKGTLGEPRKERELDNERALSWLPVVRQLANGPGASGLLASVLIQQSRALRRRGNGPATVIDMNAVDDGLETMLNEGVRTQRGE